METPNFMLIMSSGLEDYRDYIPKSMPTTPLGIASLGISAFVLMVVFLDYLTYQRQRRRLGNVAIVGDAPYLWRRLRWTENESNFRKVIQRGYDTVRSGLRVFIHS